MKIKKVNELKVSEKSPKLVEKAEEGVDREISQLWVELNKLRQDFEMFKIQNGFAKR